jgi:CheY-like chemotaxis protein
MDTKYSILYVDDEEINLRIFKNSFRREFDVITAISANEGLEILGKEKVDIIITDQMMPEITGVEFLKKISEIFPNIPPNRLMISGYAEDEDIEKAFKYYNLYKFISKPWNTDSLRQAIIEAINEKG